MANFTNEYSQFPQSIINPRIYKDVADAPNVIMPLIQQYQNYIANKDFSAATKFVNDNPGLKDYMVNAEDINAINEEIRNLEIFTSGKQQTVFYQNTEPDLAVISDVWIG